MKGKRFTRHESHKKKSVKPNWRRPRGLHNKVRLGKRGYRIKPDTGYRTPKPARGTSDGKRLVLIRSGQDLNGLKSGECILILSSRLGGRKKLELLAKMKGFKIMQGDAEELAKRITEAHEKRKKASQKKKSQRSKKKTEEKKDKKEEAKQDGMTEDEKKKAAKDEKDKILTRKE